MPSGYVEWDDDFLSTGIQEVKEETGLDIRIESVLNVVSSFLSPSHHFLALFLLARPISGEAVAGDDLVEVAWYPLGGPLTEMAFQEDVDMLEQYASGAVQGLPVDGRFASPGASVD